MFKALVLEQEDKKTLSSIRQLTISDLPEGDVLVKVDYSSLNYKDGLAITGKGKIIREFPMVPGIDFAGTVEESASPLFTAGDKVILTGWGVGENHWGGMSEMARVKASQLVHMPKYMDARKAMIIGTAGLTAMLCVMALEDYGITPSHGPILVSGASGGVGSVSVSLLSRLGYEVVAISGREQNSDMLTSLGASKVLPREQFSEPGRPLDRQLWAGAIDTVGSQLLANILSQINYGGAVAACGLAGGFDLPTTVMPFILRNVALLGVDSVMCPLERRTLAWNRLVNLLPEDVYDQVGQEVSLEEVPELAEAITNGQVTGRVLIKLS
ncbi:MDR family oxidoreductase [Parendozoicomonas haliclonae]|uniref:Putative acrylyl-CoA reductase AcuI n=1 Tax=Parendozoicomonas haliclonae TaxID=1960125 RepID=A0A1X7AP20_9GAMM|nr:MDR family oxidoreductase [Parendozoicomonas haliclonae]SMA49840.1 putative acrylyl-CoA reductase AcuI [Parendozoicomonas haliclonae]